MFDHFFDSFFFLHYITQDTENQYKEFLKKFATTYCGSVKKIMKKILYLHEKKNDFSA